MSCKDVVPSGAAALSDYVNGLDSLPANFRDPWSGCLVTFVWGERDYGSGRVKVVSYRVTGCIKGGSDPIRAAVRNALIADCDSRTGPIIPPPPPHLETRFDIAQFTGGMIPVHAPEVPMLPVPVTRVPAPTAVAVSTRPAARPSGGVITVAPQAPSEGILGGILGGIGGFITGGPGGAVIGALAGYGGTEGGETPSSPGVPTSGFGPPACPTGFRWDGNRCVATGVGGFIERWIPGGETGVLPTEPMTANGTTMGAFGIPASMPFQVGETLHGPILRCMAGSVLGKDNLCYPKGSIPNKYRKWPRGARPLLTGGDMKTLRKINTLQGRVKRAWASAGKPGNRPAPKPCPKPHHHHK